MANGLFFLTFEKMLRDTLGFDLEAETAKVALFNNSLATVNYDTNTAYGASPFNANELSNGNGYTTGGQALTGSEITVSTGTLKYTATASAWASSTFTNVQHCLGYADPASDEAIFHMDFGTTYNTSNGTFTITWNGSGIFTIDLTP